MSNGDTFEAQVSKIEHSLNVPLLVSSKLLRRVGAGQIDVASIVRLKDGKSIINIIEVKENSWISKKQIIRLHRSADYLSKMIGLCSQIKYEFIKKEFCQTDY